jgi:uncharacterized membrane protein
MPEQTPKETPIHQHDLLLLVQKGFLSSVAYRAVRRLCRDDAAWDAWALRVLLALGVGHLIAGIVFFFAFNWQSLAAMAKFSLIGGAVVLAAGITLWRGFHRVEGKIAATATFLLIGVFLAVFGQIYQTGADSWTLFALWAGLGAPLMLATPSKDLAIIWQIVAQTALWLFVEQRLSPETNDLLLLLAVMAVYHVLLLVGYEMAVSCGVAWLRAGWLRILLLLVVFGHTLASAHALLQEPTARWASVPGSVILVGLVIGGGYFYRHRRPDRGALSLIGFLVTGFVGYEVGLGLTQLFQHIRGNPAGVLLVFAILTGWGLLVLAGFTLWLRRLHRSF